MIKRKNQKGFTLVELLVVVVIIGILASVAVPNFVGAQDKAKNSGVQSNVHTIQMAVEQYGVDNGGAYGDLKTTVMADSGYISGYPKSPWNTTQASTSNDIALSGKALTKVIAAGSVGANGAQWTTSNYGAICFAESGSSLERYDIEGIGKKGNNTIPVSQVRNY